MDESKKQIEVTAKISKVTNRMHAWRTATLLLVAAFLFSAAALSFSSQYGRFLFEVDYEDVITHIDGLKRYRDFADGGVISYLKGYWSVPPHAPLHSMMATVSFAIFGVHDWAPYIMNVLVVFGYFGAVWFVIRGVRGWGVRAATLIFAGGFPVAFLSVHEFRPDYPAAILTLWDILLLHDWNPLRHSKWQCFLGGLAFAGALLAKPTVFPYTMALGGAVLVLAVCRVQTRPWSFTRLTRSSFRTWPFFLANVIVALPHFLIAGPRLIEYIIRNQMGSDKASWALKGSFWENSLYHFLGYSGSYQLGDQRWILLGIVILTCMAMGAFPAIRSILRGFDFPILATITAISFLGVAINHHDNPYFGLVFQQMLVLLAVMGLAAAWQLSTRAKLGFKYLGQVFVVVVCLLPSVFGSPWPRFRHASDRENLVRIDYARSINRNIYDTLRLELSNVDQGNVLITTYGLISNHTLQWLADKDLVTMQFLGLPNKPKEDLKWILTQREQHHQVVNFVIATAPGAYGVHDFLPSAKTADFMLEQVISNPEFMEIARLPEPNGTQIRIFRRASRFGGWTRSTGLSLRLPAEEAKNVPVRQHGLWPEVRLVVESATPERSELVMRWIPVDADMSMTLIVNGAEVRTFPSNGTRDWQSARVPIELEAGQNSVEMKLSSPQPHASGRAAVTFTELRVTNAGEDTP